MATFYEEIAQLMVDVGFMDVILPFMFVFTILFAILQKTHIMGTYRGRPKANVNSMIAFVIAFLFIASLARVVILQTIVQKLALVLVAAIMLMLITGFIGGEKVAFLKYKWTRNSDLRQTWPYHSAISSDFLTVIPSSLSLAILHLPETRFI